MAKYDSAWSGVDRGHEGQWNPRVWILPLRALDTHGPFDYNDLKHSFYDEVQSKAPELGWISKNSVTGESRSLFRDNREPWAATGVIDFDDTMMTLSDIGKKVVDGVLTYGDVLTSMMSRWSEHGENPFAVLSEVFLSVDAYRGLTFEEVIAVMQNYRRGDSLIDALQASTINITATAKRRLRALLLLMVYAGAVVPGNEVYFAGDRGRLSAILKLSNDDLREEFSVWLTDVYRKAGGKKIGKTTVNSYVNALSYLTDADAYPGEYDHCSTSYWYNMYHYLYGKDGSPIYTLESKEAVLKEFGGVYTAITEGDPPDGVDVDHFNQVRLWSQKEEVKNSSWIFYAFQRYFEFLDWRLKNNAQQEDAMLSEANRLVVALKLFERRRSEQGLSGWTSYDAWAKEARAEFAVANAGMFVAAGFDYAEFMRKFLYSTTVANSYFKDHTDADKNEVGNFISQNRNSPQAVSWYLDPANKPNAEGMNACVMLNLMTMVRPAEFALYAPPIDHMLVVTGVAKDLTPKELTVANYEANKALQGQVLAKMNELGIGKAADDDSAADFLTVGEFAWWISDETNLNLVKEKIMSTVAKEPKGDCAEDGKKSIVDALKDDVDSMMSRLTAALLTKPFAILAGASGTGKSRMVKKLAYMTCRADMLRSEKDETPGNYCMIAVKPNWHDSSDLLGYRSAFGTHDYVTTDFVKFVLKAHAFPNTPFFVCLDEMNLAPVEQYFAEYLSAVESVGKNSAGKWTGDPLIQRGEFGGAVANLHPEYQLTEEVAAAINEKGLFIPQNLFVVGTVNMDDTTNQFSRKVLDRAMTIMMNEVDFATLKGEGYEKLTNELRIKNEEIEKFIDRTIFSGALMDGGEIEDLLNGVRLALQDSPFEVGYRYAIETVLYREAIKIIKGKSEPSEEELKDFTQTAIDHTILMKILPRITGTLTEREEVLKKLEECFGNLSPHKLSADTLKAMKKTADNNGGYISFWP